MTIPVYRNANVEFAKVMLRPVVASRLGSAAFTGRPSHPLTVTRADAFPVFAHGSLMTC